MKYCAVGIWNFDSRRGIFVQTVLGNFLAQIMVD